MRGNAGNEAAWRRWLPWALIFLAALVALVSALNIWVKRQALSTDNWTKTSSQLLENQQIRGAVSVYLVNQLYQNVDVTKALEERLPPRTKALAAPLAAALQQVAVRTANAMLERPRVQRLWREANRRAHQLFIAVLDGKHKILQTSGGNVVLNLQPLVQQLSEQTGFGTTIAAKLPPDAGRIVIMKANQLETGRRAVKVIRVLSYLLFFLVIALMAAAMYIARGRRRTILMGAGVSIAIVGLIVLIVRRYTGDYVVSSLVVHADEKRAVGAAWSIGTRLLRDVGVNAVIYGVVIVFAAWIAGPSRQATWLRRKLAPTMSNHPVVIFGVVGLGLLLILLAGPTDSERIYPLLLLFGFAFAGTEVLRRQTLREFPQGQEELVAGSRPSRN